MTTNDIRNYLAENQRLRKFEQSDNRQFTTHIFQVSLHGWKMKIIFPKVPCEEYIKVRTDSLVKEVLTDENIEILRDSCIELRDGDDRFTFIHWYACR